MEQLYFDALDEGYREADIAFEGLADENVWRRPAPGLLSIGELAGHIAYWETMGLTDVSGDDGADIACSPVQSPLLDARFRYHPTTLATPPTEQHLKMTATQVCAELLRVHRKAVADWKAKGHGLDDWPPGHPNFPTYRAYLQYSAFHVAYHTGQIYTARHLLGETPPDN